MIGTEWHVESVARFVDGDTVRLVRSRIAQLGDDRFKLTDVGSKLVRLVWVDTPERGDEPGYGKATRDLHEWVADHGRWPLRVVCYESAGWDRMLGDLIDSDGNSASQWLMTERGWPPYTGGRR